MITKANNQSIKIQNDRHLSTLYQISLQGDAVGLERLIHEDALVLDRVSAVTLHGETPLHIAAMRGHFHFARVLLTHKPELAYELDSVSRVPLHWASEKGYTHIVKELLLKSPDACFWRDLDGKIPLHLAVMKQRNDVIIELVRTQPESILEKMESGGTILHLCVKHNSFDALKLLLNTAQGHELVNASDDHGNTILDLPVTFKQVEIIKYLLSERINARKNTSNMKVFTAEVDSRALEIKIEAGADQLKSQNPTTPGCSVVEKCKRWWNKYMTNVECGLQQARGSILVAATVTASMAFQAGINPPRFRNQAAIQLQPKEIFGYPLIANILRSDHFDPSHGFWLFNTKSFFFSLAIIMLMQSGIPIRNKLSTVILVICMCSVVTSTLSAYQYAAKEVNIVPDGRQVYTIVFAVMFYLIIILHVCTFVMSLAFKVFQVSKC